MHNVSVPFALAPHPSEQALVKGQEGWVTAPVCALPSCCSRFSLWGHSEQQHCEMCQVLARHLQVSFIFLAKLKTRIEGLVAQAG